ncbi:MAG: N-acetylmuramoyl-L-alanine amidase [Bacteroidaceae bacterium]|nr:N-acetylmuramoyl-L-alanine amidase [Bacteroidaceae bacterium]
MKILVDNGHGSNATGNCSPDKQLYEYAYCREIAKMLVKKLCDNGYDAERITPEERNVSIGERCRRANAICKKIGAKNCVLISIHNNAITGKWGEACGFSVFVSKNASSNSKKLAELFYRHAKDLNLMGNRSIPPADKEGRHFWTWSWRKDDIGILCGTLCPAVLTENLYMDNRRDVDFLISDKGKQSIVDLHYDAITKYIKGT